MFIILQILIINLGEWVTCTIDGLTYMDEISLKGQLKTWPQGEDPCKPLYWYPRQIPEYCYYKNNLKSPLPVLPPMPMPIPVPLPQGIPGPLLPVPGGTYPSYSYIPNDLYRRQEAGMVPGLPGLVSADGGLNILPFSDAYTDMLENHKHKMLKKRFRELINDYEDYPRRRRVSRRRRKHRKIRRKPLNYPSE